MFLYYWQQGPPGDLDHLRYEIDPDKLADFEAHLKGVTWPTRSVRRYIARMGMP